MSIDNRPPRPWVAGASFRLALVTFLALAAASADAATYYVDFNAGNNANPGTQASPWKTPPGAACVRGLATCQSQDGGTGWRKLATGDTVLLNAGESYPMLWLVTPAKFDAGVTIDRYGSGPDPTIEGGENVSASTWQNVSTNVYAIPFNGSVQLWSAANDHPQMFRNGFRWALNGTINDPSKSGASGCGALSNQGEMFFDSANNRICVYSTSDPRSDGSSWYVGFRRLGIYATGVPNLTIRHIRARNKSSITNIFGGEFEITNGSNGAILDGVTAENSGGSGVRVFPDSSAVTNFTLRNSVVNDSWAYGVEIQAINMNPANYLLDSNQAYNNGDHGLECNKINGCTMTRNIVHDNSIGQGSCGTGPCGPQMEDRGSGITVTGGSQNLTITKNVVYANGRRAMTGDAQCNGIYLIDLGGTNLVANNTVYDHIGMGIVIEGTIPSSAVFKILANTVVDNDTAQLMEYATNGIAHNGLIVKDNILMRTKSGQKWSNAFFTTTTIAAGQVWDYNNVYNSVNSTRQYFCGDAAGYSAKPCNGWDAHGLHVDPRFVDFSHSDFHLQPGSPCKDAGTSLAPDVTDDRDGDARPQGSGWDIGSDEVNEGTAGVGAPTLLVVTPVP